MGAVWVALDREQSQDVALKRLKPNEGTQADEWVAQAGSLVSLRHPNVVSVYDVGKDAEGAYLAMELLRGRTLDAVVGEAPLSVSDFLDLAKQALGGPWRCAGAGGVAWESQAREYHGESFGCRRFAGQASGFWFVETGAL